MIIILKCALSLCGDFFFFFFTLILPVINESLKNRILKRTTSLFLLPYIPPFSSPSSLPRLLFVLLLFLLNRICLNCKYILWLGCCLFCYSRKAARNMQFELILYHLLHGYSLFHISECALFYSPRKESGSSFKYFTKYIFLLTLNC